jgi:hypothetical protein
MPGDLLRYLGGPAGLSWWWWVLAGLFTAAIIAWYAGVVVWTLPAPRLRAIPVIRDLHVRLLRRRFAGTVANIAEQYRAGAISGGNAAGAMSRTLRSFLQVATGARVQFMHIADIADNTELAPAAPVFTALNDAQFSTDHADVDRLGDATQQVIRSWT